MLHELRVRYSWVRSAPRERHADRDSRHADRDSRHADRDSRHADRADRADRDTRLDRPGATRH
jgi:hypothetical protein